MSSIVMLVNIPSWGCILILYTKGQINSEWIYEIINFQKITRIIGKISALGYFIVHKAEILQFFGSFFGKLMIS